MLQIRCIFLLITFINCSNSWSEVTLDGTMGRAGALAGPDYQITENLGHRAGSNLFHSFGNFNLGSAESATFSGNPVIQNIISRVTGGSPSSIDGALRSIIPNANLYFINPAGVFFGPNASLDVQGSFHVSTADYLGLKDGARFSAVTPNNTQVLTTAAPETFGFLGDNPSSITLAQAELKVPNGESLSVIGGDISLVGGDLIAPAGRIDLASVSSKGEVVRQNNDLSLNGFEQLGKIELTERSRVNTSGEGGGAIFIRGGELALNESAVRSETFGSSDGDAIDIALDEGTLELHKGGLIIANTTGSGRGGDLLVNAQNISLNADGSGFRTGLISETESTGSAGNIEVTAESLEVANGSQVSSTTQAAGNGGNVNISTGSVNVTDGAQISARTIDTGNGGSIFLEADNIMLSGNGSDTPTGLFTTTKSSGNAGDISIRSNSLDMFRAGKVFTGTQGAGTGGLVLIEAGNIHMSDIGTNIRSDTFDAGDLKDIIIKTDSLEFQDGSDISVLGGLDSSGDLGKIIINANNFEIRNGSKIQSLTLGTGIGGDVIIEAGNMLLSGDGVGIPDTGLFLVNIVGSASDVKIVATNLTIQNGAEVNTSTVGSGEGGDISIQAENVLLSGDGAFGTGLFSVTLGGDAGDVSIDVTNLDVRDNAQITATSLNGGNGGNINIIGSRVLLSGRSGTETGLFSVSTGINDAGNITIIADDSLHILDGASISVETETADAGDINISADNLVQLRDSKITTSVAGGQGDGGNIFIGRQPDASEVFVHVPIVTALDNSSIIARAAQGRGGNIGITSDFIFISQNSIMDSSSSDGGIDGTVNINSPESNISGSIVALPENHVNVSEHLSERCAARSVNISSFVIKDLSTVPPGPDDAAASMFFENDLPQGLSSNTMANSDRFVVSQQRETESTDRHSLNTNPDNNTGLFFAEVDCGK